MTTPRRSCRRRLSATAQSCSGRPSGQRLQATADLERITFPTPTSLSHNWLPYLRLTLLAAGFVVGPGGASIREVCAVTGADIRSQTDEYRGRRVRTMVLQVRGVCWRGLVSPTCSMPAFLDNLPAQYLTTKPTRTPTSHPAGQPPRCGQGPGGGVLRCVAVC